ncbi:thermostable hemolysin [Xanthobacter autotrophicus DSM 431]|uniref:thermostable hemolysin n=1 Tax=Xanthobacter nonsaccharivorans TaxID=3119912 RepID=UPI00372BC0F3
MKSVYIVEPTDADRPRVEAFIREIYAREFGARIEQFANHLMCRVGPRGEIMCAAGLRLAADGFFSEQYLAEPVEAALARATGCKVHRDEVYEVTTLASRSPREIAAFVDDIIGFGARSGMSWSFFTLTRRLALLVQRRRLAPIHLADAAASRVPDPGAWGRYYETEPKVYGVCGAKLLAARAPTVARSCHADLL